MSLDSSRIVSAAMLTLTDKGFKPDDVPFGETGKSALEHIVEAVAVAVVNEIKEFAEVTTKLSHGHLEVWSSGVPFATDGGLALQTSTKLVLGALPDADQAEGGIK